MLECGECCGKIVFCNIKYGGQVGLIEEVKFDQQCEGGWGVICVEMCETEV